MPILDNINPTQAIECDLCGIRFDRKIKKSILLIGDGWEEISIYISTHVGAVDAMNSQGFIKIDYACEPCRLAFTEHVRGIIEKMTK